MQNLINTDKCNLKLTPDIVKKYLVNGNGNVTDQEVMMFLSLCKFQNLNPFLREAYLIKFGSEPATIVTGKEVFTKRASKIEKCDGWDSGIVIIKDNELIYRAGTLIVPGETLIGGWCEVRRKDWSKPARNEVSLNEYMRTTKEGKPIAQWSKMPATMIRKVAIVQTLREVFPESFQGMYDLAEMPVEESQLKQEPINIEDMDLNGTSIEESNKEIATDDGITISEAQRKRMFAISKSNNDLVKKTIQKYGFEHSNDVTKETYDVICEEIKYYTKQNNET